MENKYKTNACRFSDILKVHIEDGILKIGEKIPSERKLAIKYGISRPSIREGVRQLSALGYVETIKNKGTYVSNKYLEIVSVTKIEKAFSMAPIMNLMEVRLILEKNILRYAIERATQNDFKNMRAALDKMSNSTSLDEFYRSDNAFHLAIVKASHNEVAIEIMDEIFRRMNQNIEFLHTTLETRSRTLSAFIRIATCIEEKKIEEAQNLFEIHLNDVEEVLQKLYIE